MPAVKTLYKVVNNAARLLGTRRLEAWSYAGWLRRWMREDPVMGYWKFAAEYLGTGEIPTGADA